LREHELRKLRAYQRGERKLARSRLQKLEREGVIWSLGTTDMERRLTTAFIMPGAIPAGARPQDCAIRITVPFDMRTPAIRRMVETTLKIEAAA
jgi:hypothetical protein